MGGVGGGGAAGLARAGAAACVELAVWRVPAVLVPLPDAPRDHQAANAAVLEREGGACMVRQRELTPERVGALLAEITGPGAGTDRLAAAFDHVGRHDAAQRLANLLERVV